MFLEKLKANKVVQTFLICLLLAAFWGICSLRIFPKEDIYNFGFTPKFLNIANISIETGQYSSELIYAGFYHSDGTSPDQIVDEVQREPLYSFTLIFFKQIGLEYSHVIFLQFAVIIFTIALWLFFILRVFGKKVAAIFYILLFFNSIIPFYSSVLYPYTFQFCFLSLSFIATYLALKKNLTKYYVLSGVFLALSIYERAAYIAFPLLLSFLLFILSFKLNFNKKGTLLLPLVCFAVLSPWLFRNFRLGVMGMSEMSGYTLGYTFGDLKSDNPSEKEIDYDLNIKEYGTDAGTLGFIESKVDSDTSYSESSKEVTKIIIHKLFSNKIELLRRIKKEVLNYPETLFTLPKFNRSTLINHYNSQTNTLMNPIDVLICVTALVSIGLLTIRKNIFGLLAVIFIIYNILFSTTIVIFDARYRGMIDILLYIAFAWGVLTLFKYLNKRFQLLNIK